MSDAESSDLQVPARRVGPPSTVSAAAQAAIAGGSPMAGVPPRRRPIFETAPEDMEVCQEIRHVLRGLTPSCAP